MVRHIGMSRIQHPPEARRGERHQARRRERQNVDPGKESARVAVAGVSLSHPHRVLFESAGATKLDLATYYEAIADWIVPHLAGRPLTLVRCPAGVHERTAGAHQAPECVYMRHSKAWGPSALRRVRIREKTKTGEYLIADSIEAVVSLAQIDVLEIHTWNSRVERIEQPDRVVLDIDPGERVGWPAVVEAARLIRSLLEELDLTTFVKTTGGRGLHVVAPLTPRASWAECLAFARAVAETLERAQPGTFTTKFAKAGRCDKLLIDYLRNNRTNTSVAAYSTRAKPEAPVSTPISWSELSAGATPDRFTISTARKRVTRLRSDPWKDYWTCRQLLRPGAIAALRQL